MLPNKGPGAIPVIAAPTIALVQLAVVNHADTIGESAEVAGGQYDTDAGVASRRKDRKRAAPRVAGNGNALGIDRFIFQRPSNEPGNAPDPLADGGSTDQHAVSGRNR